MTTTHPDDIITVAEAAEMLRTPLATVYYLMRTGRLPHAKIGGRYRLSRRQLEATILAPLREGVDPSQPADSSAA